MPHESEISLFLGGGVKKKKVDVLIDISTPIPQVAVMHFIQYSNEYNFNYRGMKSAFFPPVLSYKLYHIISI